MPHIPFRLLAVDDDAVLLKSLERILRKEPLQLLTCADPTQVLDLLARQQVDLVLLDLCMPGLDGLRLLEQIQAFHPGLPVIMLTGHGGVSEAVAAMQRGARDFLEKPCAPQQLLAKLQPFYRDRPPQADQAPAAPGFDFPPLIGQAPAMQDLKERIARVAQSDATILIHGETGSGKELVAQALHAHSRRRQGPFVPVDCATLSSQIIESELFGHSQGAFTGAIRAQQGLFRAANGGSLFLDEVGEFPLELQAKLLRSLQQRQVRPVGSSQAEAVDIRLIAATNKDLAAEVRHGRFRDDLYYRLSAIVLQVPPLRQRLEDLPQLCQALLPRLAGGLPVRLDAAVLPCLQRYNWPGNVRELENVLSHALALQSDGVIRCKDLPPLQYGEETPAATDNLLLANERAALQDALRRTNGNRRAAAALLGISEATLYRKLKKNGLSGR
ncbi:sigma-54-dependent transcriptional regulator [Desulfuromonas thiophila]|uniref:Two-component system, NtrC family, response regulator PilR n=1 Tax=Desulfuromonas thiophila TaxID=57664 RepID=A0A1G7CVX5_9BACT|nr:sigma-54 dependent transcriptional regulator [Desulfuromonas thiophila]SDE43469.1 two-component system, NtrC family, response regulator PilR [Desulfuromonas thiophila]